MTLDRGDIGTRSGIKGPPFYCSVRKKEGITNKTTTGRHGTGDSKSGGPGTL